MICGEQIVINEKDDAGEAATLRCKRWSCKDCLPMLRREVIAKAMAGKPKAMLTLTCNPKLYLTPDEAARDMKRALVLLRRHLADRFGIEKLPFICVFERHQSGWPHMHLLIRGPFIPWKWLSLEWKRLVGAFHVDIRKIHGPTEAAKYVAKYIGKEPFAFEGCKRYWRSHNFDLSAPNDEKEIRPKVVWRRENQRLHQLVTYLETAGAIIEAKRSYYVAWCEAPVAANFRTLINWKPPPDAGAGYRRLY